MSRDEVSAGLLLRGFGSAHAFPVVAIAGAVLVIHWPLLVSVESLFWDDYTFFNGANLLFETKQQGRPWVGWAFAPLASLGPWPFKLLGYTSIAAGALAVKGILAFWPGISRSFAILGGVGFVIAPVAFSRVTPAINLFQTSTTVFLVAWYLLVSSFATKVRPSIGRTLATAGLFFLSIATTESLAVLMVLPILHYFILLRGAKSSTYPNLLAETVRHQWLTLAAPFLGFLIPGILFPPFGDFLGYNAIAMPSPESDNFSRLIAFTAVATISGILLVVRPPKPRRFSLCWIGEVTVLVALGLTFWEIADFRDRGHKVWQIIEFDEAANLYFPGTLLAFAAIIIASNVPSLRRKAELQSNGPRAFRPSLILFGSLGLALGVVPYLLVGKPPHPAAFADRLEILLPVGFAFIVTGVAQLVILSSHRWLGLWVVGAAITLTVGVSFSQFALLSVDWKKQELVIAALQDQPQLSAFSTIVVRDESRYLNWDNRANPLYEVTGWVAAAYGRQGILAVSHDTYQSYLDREILADQGLQSRYGFPGWDENGAVVNVVFASDSSKLEVFLGRGKIRIESID